MNINVESDTAIIDGITYYRNKPEEKLLSEYHIVRTLSAGVFMGIITKRNGQEVEMENARRLWYWDGASSLSQLAAEGVKRPQNCKFPIPLRKITLLQAIEIIPCEQSAVLSIQGVPIWKQ